MKQIIAIVKTCRVSCLKFKLICVQNETFQIMASQIIRDTTVHIGNDFYAIICEEKKVLNFIRTRSNDAFNVSHQKGLIFLTRLRVGLSHLKEHKFKRSFFDTLNPFCFGGFDIETLNQFFRHSPRFTKERQNFCLTRIRLGFLGVFFFERVNLNLPSLPSSYFK